MASTVALLASRAAPHIARAWAWASPTLKTFISSEEGKNTALGVAALIAGISASRIANDYITDYRTKAQISKQEAELAERTYREELPIFEEAERDRLISVDADARQEQAETDYQDFMYAQNVADTRKVNASGLALWFAQIMRLRYPKAFAMNPGLTRSIETRLTGAIQKNELAAIRALERVVEHDVSIMNQRAILGEKSSPPITY